MFLISISNMLLYVNSIKKINIHQSRCNWMKTLQLLFCHFFGLRDWSLITGRGGYKMGKSGVQNLLCAPPPPQDKVKLSTTPPLKMETFCVSPFNMAKTSSYRIKITPKLVVPLFSMAKTFSAPLFRRGKTSHAPLPFCSPPPPHN